jgi:hypothetical protein
MKLTVSSLFLAILQCHTAYSAVVNRATKRVTLDIVNANLAPDGFERSMYHSFYKLYEMGTDDPS